MRTIRPALRLMGGPGCMAIVSDGSCAAVHSTAARAISGQHPGIGSWSSYALRWLVFASHEISKPQVKTNKCDETRATMLRSLRAY